MIELSITLLIFANIIRYVELSENTTVRTFKDYVNYSEKVVIKFNLVWALITLIFWLFDNL